MHTTSLPQAPKHQYLFDLVILTLLFLHKDLVRTYPNNYFNPLSNQVINLEKFVSRSLVLSPHKCFSTVRTTMECPPLLLVPAFLLSLVQFQKWSVCFVLPEIAFTPRTNHCINFLHFIKMHTNFFIFPTLQNFCLYRAHLCCILENSVAWRSHLPFLHISSIDSFKTNQLGKTMKSDTTSIRIKTK